jgi:hypothetical protein
MSQWLAWAFHPSSSSSSSSLTVERPKQKSNKQEEHSAPPLSLPTPSAPPSESPSIRELSSSEFCSLESENLILRNALEQLKKQIQKQNKTNQQQLDMSMVRGFVVSGTSKTSMSVADQAFLDAQKEFESMKKQLETQTNQDKQEQNESNIEPPAVVSSSSSAHSDGLLTLNGAPLVVKNLKFQSKAGSKTATEGGEFPIGDDDGEPVDIVEEEVAVVDLADSDWWTIVNPTDEEDAKATELPTRDSMDDDFVVLNKSDSMEALADFISKSIQRHYPEAARLPPDQLRRMLDGTFHELKDPGKIGRAWQWGKFMYSTYGWGTTVWNLYREPAMVKLVASGVYQAATWILVLVI